MSRKIVDIGYIFAEVTDAADESYITVSDSGMGDYVVMNRHEAIAAARAILKHYGEGLE